MNKFDLIYLVVGGLMLGTGIYIRIWVDRRRFYRRGVGGLQQFPSYFKAKLFTFLEGLLMLISIPIILLGILILVRLAIHLVDRTKYKKIDRIETEKEPIQNTRSHFLLFSENGHG